MKNFQYFGLFLDEETKKGLLDVFLTYLEDKTKKSMIDMWIARDEDGSLYIYKGKPSRYNGFFDNVINYSSISLNSDLFPEVTWENSPQEIEIILKK